MEYNSLFVINVVVVCLSLAAIVVLLFMIHETSLLNEEMNREIKEIDKKCPDCNCPECPKNPECPKCNVRCPNVPECPKCPEISDMNNDMDNDMNNDKDNIDPKKIVTKAPCPKCQECRECPSVDDIVSGIYPGRNPKVVDGGRYFKIDASNTYDGLSTSNFYEKNYKFPMDKILKPDIPDMNAYNLGGSEQIDNSIDNENIDTNVSRSLPSVNNEEDIENIAGSSSDGESDGESDRATMGDQSYLSSFYHKILPDNFM